MTARGTFVTQATMCATRLDRYSSSCDWMLWAVADASPLTTSMAGTIPMAKAPPTMLIRYRAPAILASCRALIASRLYGAPYGCGQSGLGQVSGTHEFLDLVGEGDEVRDPGLDLAVDVVDIGLLAVIGEKVPQVREVLEPIRERSLDDRVAREGIEDVVVGLGLGKREGGHQIRAGPEEELDRLLKVPLRQAVELRVGLELGVLDRPEVVQKRRVLPEPRDARAHVGGIDREAVPTRALGERLRLHIVVLLELQVVHNRARFEMHAPPLVTLVEEAPAPDDLGALEQRGLVEDHDVEALDLQRLGELAHEIDLVIEKLARVHAREEQKSDIEILIGARDPSACDRSLRVCGVDRRSLEETLQLGLLFEEVHTYLYKAGAVPWRAPLRFASIRYPSVPPRSASTQRSGCGMRPTTLPSSFATPAIFPSDPFGFAAAVTTPRSST